MVGDKYPWRTRPCQGLGYISSPSAISVAERRPSSKIGSSTKHLCKSPHWPALRRILRPPANHCDSGGRDHMPEIIPPIFDRREEDAYRSDRGFRGLVDTSAVRASLSVALRRDETLLGIINVYRQEKRPFSERPPTPPPRSITSLA